MRVLLPAGGRPPGGWTAGQRVSLDDSEVHHLRVRRAQDREIVELLDGTGLRGTGRLVQTGKQWAVEVQSARQESRPVELTLAVAAGDRDRFSWMVEKAVELGVTRILPLETARTSGVATGIRDAHLRRLRRHALEATKQCGVSWAVQVEEPLSLADFRGQPLTGPGWLADRSGAPPPTRLGGNAMTVVIGPEGGLTDAERAGLVAAGYLPIVLGPHTLRFETAALAAAALATTARMRGAMADCLFCRIVAGEIPAKIVKRSDDALAFRDIDAKAPVHLLVIPTRHIAAVRDAKGADGERLVGRLLVFAADVASELGLDGDGYRIVTNTGRNAGQSVDHLHLHVLGGRKMTWPPG